jgi:hypothetical protein
VTGRSGRPRDGAPSLPAARMSLSPFAAEHAAAVAGWTASAAESRLWCGRADFPMPPETVTAWAGSADVRA